jgi:hypothetical protein
MELNNVKFDGTTLYHCRKKGRDCVIETTLSWDGAALIALDWSDEHFGDTWLTEACFLEPAKNTNERVEPQHRATGLRTVDVGTHEKKKVSELNNELYLAAKNLMLEKTDKGIRLWHIGWGEVGDFVDWLEQNYEINKKAAL